MSKVFEVLKRLDDAKVHYVIGRYRSDTIDITAEWSANASRSPFLRMGTSKFPGS